MATQYFVIYHDNKNPQQPVSLMAKDLTTARRWIKEIRAGNIPSIGLHKWGVYLVKVVEHYNG